MTTSTHPVDVAESYARRKDDSIWVQLLLPGEPSLEAPTLRLRHTERRGERADARATTTAGPRGALLTASVPSSGLRPGVWQLRLRADDASPFQRVQARLLVSADQPIALLPGPVPDTRMPPPAIDRPRSRTRSQRGASLARYRGRLASLARRVTRSGRVPGGRAARR